MTFPLSSDPELIENAAEGFWLHLALLDNLALLDKVIGRCVDEKSQTQALDPAQRVRSTSHDSVRYGATTLCAALEIATHAKAEVRK